jgi:hypothetical protein
MQPFLTRRSRTVRLRVDEPLPASCCRLSVSRRRTAAIDAKFPHTTVKQLPLSAATTEQQRPAIAMAE